MFCWRSNDDTKKLLYKLLIDDDEGVSIPDIPKSVTMKSAGKMCAEA